MKTSSFFQYTGPGRISVARYAPRNTPPGFRIYSALAPAREMLKMEYEPYVHRYKRQLNTLNAQTVYETLTKMAAPHEPVLLCWENLSKPGNWCHRRMVADWFKKELGIVVEELEVREEEK